MTGQAKYHVTYGQPCDVSFDPTENLDAVMGLGPERVPIGRVTDKIDKPSDVVGVGSWEQNRSPVCALKVGRPTIGGSSPSRPIAGKECGLATGG
jgi:hypothetical protein